MKQAECINGFSVEKCDDNGFTIDGEFVTVEEGSIWNIEQDNFIVIGGEVRLTNDEYGWLEIPKEQFEIDFKTIN